MPYRDTFCATENDLTAAQRAARATKRYEERASRLAEEDAQRASRKAKDVSLRQLLTSVFAEHGESWDDVHSIAYGARSASCGEERRITDDEEIEAVLEKRAYPTESYHREPFVVWTAKSLYVTYVSDDYFYIDRLPRNPEADFIPRVLGVGW